MDDDDLLIEALQAQLRARLAANGTIPQMQQPGATVDLRPQPGETREQYQRRLEAARASVQPSPGTQEMTNLAERAMTEQPQQPPRQVGVVEDVLRSGAAGIGRGVVGLAGLPGTAREMMGGALQSVGVPTQYADAISRVSMGPFFNAPSSQELMPVASNLTGGAIEYDPRTTAGEYAGTVGEFLPGGAAARAPMLYGVIPGLASEAAGQATEGTWLEPWARVGAALTAPAGAAAITNPGGIARAVYGPRATPSQERLAAADTLEDAGVPLTAGQRAGDDMMIRREMMTRKGQGIREGQEEAFTRAVLSTVGEDATRATPEVMEAIGRRVGSVFDDVQRGVDVIPDVALADRAKDIAETYNSVLNVLQKSPLITRVANQIRASVTSGRPISGDVAMRWRSELSEALTDNSAATRTAAGALRDVLDDALGQTLTSMGRAEDVARLAQARDQWRTYLALVRATSGPASAEGIISPASFRSAIAAQDRTAYVTGNRGDVGEIARAGDTILRRPNTSGTAENLRATGLPEVATGIGGATLGGTMDLNALAVLAMGATAAGAPSAYRRIGMSDMVQNALRTQGPPLLMPGYVNSLAGFAAPSN
jgi:hypothetical protein